jgi:hypothetical protein
MEIMIHNMTADKGVISPECVQKRFVKGPIKREEEPYKGEGCDYFKQYVYNLNIFVLKLKYCQPQITYVALVFKKKKPWLS